MNPKILLPNWLAGLLSLIVLCGCETEPPQPAPVSHDADRPPSHAAQTDHDHEGHDHEGHDHAHMGIHGGHVVVLEPGHIHAEWVHVDEEETLEVYVLDSPESVKSVKLVSQVQGQEAVEYVLEPAAEELGKGGYQIKSPNLLTSVEMADGATNIVKLIVETDDATLEAGITDSGEHEHDH